MKKSLIVLGVLAASALLPAQAVTNIGVSIGINAPGQYGRIDINNYPQAVLVTPQPVIYAPSPVAVYQRPIYLYVPPMHQSQWGRYCKHYGACGQPVYFVREDWVRTQYQHEHDAHYGGRAPHDKHGHGHDNGKHKGHQGHDG